MIRIGHGNEIGILLARALHGSWRATPAALDLAAAELTRILPQVVQTGVSALVHRRLSGTPLEASGAATELLAGVRHIRLCNRIIEHRLPRVLDVLESAGIPALLVKGASVARGYADPGARPYGDLDICVPPARFSAAKQALVRAQPLGVAVDLHRGTANEQGERMLEDPPADVFDRSRRVPIGADAVSVRVPGPEDHLRLICMHMMRHGVSRPLWLCDVAATVESLPAGFDLERCLGRDRPRSDWVALSISLAHDLLGARLPAGFVPQLPGWVRTAVLRTWTEHGEEEPRPIRTYLLDPRGLYDKLRWRWVNPLAFAVWWKGPLRTLPRLRFQVREFITPGSRMLRMVPETRKCELELTAG